MFHFVKALWNREYRQGIWRIKSRSLRTRINGKIVSFSPFKLISIRNVWLLNNSYFALNASFIERFVYRRKLNVLGFLDSPIVFIDSLNLAYFLDYFESPTVIYRPTDDYLSMPNQSLELSKVERLVIDKAKSIVATSYHLREIICERYKRQSTVIENGIDVKLLGNFDVGKHPVFDKIDQSKRTLVYIGSLDSRFDYGLLHELDKIDCFNVVLCGNTDIFDTDKFENVHLIRNLDYNSIGRLYANADIGILPFDRNHLGNKTRSPMKLYEMLFFGLPVVSTIDYQSVPLQIRDLVYYGSNNDDFIQSCCSISTKKLGRQFDWREVSWDQKAKDILSVALA